MIHISSSKGSSICNTRPRFNIFLITIVFLLISLLYAVSLNSTNQTNVEILQLKIKQYQRKLKEKETERESYLSSLQSLQNGRSKIKDELNRQIAKHETSVREFEKQYQTLSEERNAIQAKLESVENDLRVYMNQHINATEKIAGKINGQKNKIAQLDGHNKELEELNEKLTLDQEKFQRLSKELLAIKSSLKDVGPDVLNLNHRRLDEMDGEDRLQFISLFAKSYKEARYYDKLRSKKIVSNVGPNSTKTNQADDVRGTAPSLNKKEDFIGKKNQSETAADVNNTLSAYKRLNKVHRLQKQLADETLEDVVKLAAIGDKKAKSLPKAEKPQRERSRKRNREELPTGGAKPTVQKRKSSRRLKKPVEEDQRHAKANEVDEEQVEAPVRQPSRF